MRVNKQTSLKELFHLAPEANQVLSKHGIKHVDHEDSQMTVGELFRDQDDALVASLLREINQNHLYEGEDEEDLAHWGKFF